MTDFFERPNWRRLLELGISQDNVGEPFGQYKDHDDCVSKNQDKDDPDAYCATIRRNIEPGAEGIYPLNAKDSAALSSTSEKASAVDRLKSLGLVAFEMHSKLAVPTVSGNKRKWTEATLKQYIPHWIGKPVMLDHSQGTGDVVATTTDAFWGPSRIRQEDNVDALRAHSWGIMDAALFEKLRTDGKNVIGVPLIKGLSIGGGADITYDEEQNEVPMNFIPEEYSITPFPGIKEAEIEKMVPVWESLRKHREDGIKQRIIESQMPEFIPVFLIPLRGEACPEGYEKDTVGNNCVIPQQMAKLAPEVQEYLKKGATGHVLISSPADKAQLYVSKEWVQKAIKAVDETGRPPKDWWDDCIDGVTKSGAADDPAAVCGNVWFHVLGEWAKARVKEAKQQKVELTVPAKMQAQFNKIYEKLMPEKIEVEVPDNLFTRSMKDVMTLEEQKEFDAMVLDLERQRRGLPSLREEEHGMVEPNTDGSCPEGYDKGDDGKCHLKMSQTRMEDPKKEAAAHKRIVEQLEKEVTSHREDLARVDALRKERDDLKRQLQERASLYKALDEHRRLPATLPKGKSITQGETSIRAKEIVDTGDSDALYEYFRQQGYSRDDAAKAVIYTMMEQALG